MIAVIFEFQPNEAGKADYWDLTGKLRPLLDKADGFISIERFESVTTPGKFVSLSFWRDEAALAAWRKVPAHRKAQSAGRARLFDDYRLRVAAVIRDYGKDERAQAPADSREAHGG